MDHIKSSTYVSHFFFLIEYDAATILVFKVWLLFTPGLTIDFYSLFPKQYKRLKNEAVQKG